MVQTAKSDWATLDGYAAAHNLGWLQEMPVSRFFNLVWYLMTKDSESREVEKLRARLWQPERGQVVVDPRSPWSAANEASSLGAFKRGMGG